VGRAFLVLRPGARVTAEELRDFLRPRLAAYKIPVYVDVVDELPKTGSGKIHKPRLRDLPLPVSR
jgi:fatty-acyl-CoA synthase